MRASKIIGLLVAFATAAAGLVVGLAARQPVLSGYRPWGFVFALALCGAPLLGALVARRLGNRLRPSRSTVALAALLSVAAAAGTLAAESRYQQAKTRVLAMGPARLAPLGRHLIVGYRDFAEVKRLVELGAIGGLFITHRNVAGRSVTEVADEIAVLQAIAREHGNPPLIIATDQEGGRVSRLSPPLPHQPPLREMVARYPEAEARTQAVFDYAREQGRGLAALGVTLNFAPVVDLDFAIAHPGDHYSRITERALAREPAVVTAAARAYCDGLMSMGIVCTLKHFPGLGRARGDTHRGEVRLESAVDDLAREDWAPFELLREPTPAIVMVGHVRLDAVDPERPASLSAKVIDGLLRDRLGHTGVIVTDDLCMGAITMRPEGIGQAAVQALSAGADLLLLSWDGEQVYAALDALLDAERDGRISPSLLERSTHRLAASPLWRQTK